MYKIIGADEKEYGPVSAEQVRQWIAQGRINPRTPMQSEGSAEWKPLADLAEFADVLKDRMATSPPVAPPALPAHLSTRAKTSGAAIASLVLGILGFCGITALAGLILGIVSLVKINRSQGRLSGTGLAIAGICVSAFMLFISIPVLAGLTLPALAQAKSRAQNIQSMNNAKQLALATLMFAGSNGDRLPAAASWCDKIQGNIPGGNFRIFQRPGGDPGQRCHYAFNSQLSGVALADISSQSATVLLFETGGGWNVNGGAELLPQNSRRTRSVVVVFVDGHAEMVPQSRLNYLRWNP